jgi:hypothetical protein
MKPKEHKKESDETRKKESSGPALTSEQLRAYAGDYWSEELGVTYRLGTANGKINIVGVLDRSGFPRANNFSHSELQPVGTDRFRIGSESIIMSFERDTQGAATGFTVDAGRTTGMTFRREPIPAK